MFSAGCAPVTAQVHSLIARNALFSESVISDVRCISNFSQHFIDILASSNMCGIVDFSSQKYSGSMEKNIDTLTDEQRLSEVAGILAAGIVRFKERQKQSKSAPSGELPLDFVPTRSMCVTVTKTEKHHE
jgi:hypothetical protein